MAYRIEYQMHYIKRKNIRRRKRSSGLMKTVIILLLTVILSYVFTVLFQLHAIGEADMLVEASERFVQDIQSGVSVADAVEVFCDGLIK